MQDSHFDRVLGARKRGGGEERRPGERGARERLPTYGHALSP